MFVWFISSSILCFLNTRTLIRYCCIFVERCRFTSFYILLKRTLRKHTDLISPLGCPWEHTADSDSHQPACRLFPRLSYNGKVRTIRFPCASRRIFFFLPDWSGGIILMIFRLDRYPHNPAIKLKTRRWLAVYYRISRGSVWTPTHIINTPFPLQMIWSMLYKVVVAHKILRLHCQGKGRGTRTGKCDADLKSPSAQLDTQMVHKVVGILV